jgi:hypothetical protein
MTAGSTTAAGSSFFDVAVGLSLPSVPALSLGLSFSLPPHAASEATSASAHDVLSMLIFELLCRSIRGKARAGRNSA